MVSFPSSMMNASSLWMPLPSASSVVMIWISPSLMRTVPSVLMACFFVPVTVKAPLPVKMTSPEEVNAPFLELVGLSERLLVEPASRLMNALVVLFNCRAGSVVPVMWASESVTV